MERNFLTTGTVLLHSSGAFVDVCLFANVLGFRFVRLYTDGRKEFSYTWPRREGKILRRWVDKHCTVV